MHLQTIHHTHSIALYNTQPVEKEDTRVLTDSENVQRVENEEDGVVDEASQECSQHHVRSAVV